MCWTPGGGGMGMLPSDGVLRCPRVWARGRIAPSEGVRLCPRFRAMAADTWVGVSDWLGSFLKLSARRSNRGLMAGAWGAAGVLTPVTGVRGYSSGSEGRRDFVELQSDSEDRESSVTEGDGSMQGRAESWCLVRDRDRFRLGGEVLRRKRPVRWKRPSFFLRCSSLRSCSSWSTCQQHQSTSNAKQQSVVKYNLNWRKVGVLCKICCVCLVVFFILRWTKHNQLGKDLDCRQIRLFNYEAMLRS